MNSRSTARRPRSTPTSRRDQKRVPVLAIAAGALALVAIVGIAIAVANEEGDDPRPAHGPVFTEGAGLPRLEGGADAAIGTTIPRVEGISPDGEPVVLKAGEPMLVAFVAHWCPHCQAELPILVDLAEAGAFEGVRTVAVLTDSRAGAPNYPPAAWLDDEGWTGEVLLDDRDNKAAAAFGVSGYPFLVAVDAAGNVVERTSGELPADAVSALAEAARGS